MRFPTVIVLDDTDDWSSHYPSDFMTVSCYESGRPCVIVNSKSTTFTEIAAGFGKIVVLGDVTAGERVTMLARSTDDWKTFSKNICEIPGQWIAVTSRAAHAVCVHLPLLSRIPVFWKETSAGRIASTSLSYLVGSAARVDVDQLPFYLLPLGVPWPFSARSLWCGVRRMLFAERLDITATTRTTSRVWYPEGATLERHEVVEILKGELPRVMTRLCEHEKCVAVDCSGGLDSTAVAYMAYETGVRIRAYHVMPADPGNDDSRWASQVMSDIGAVAVVTGSDSMSSFFAEPSFSVDNDIEGPFMWSAGRDHLHDTAASDIAHGIRVHLTGFGGEELFSAMPAQLWSHLRQRKFRAVATIWRAARMNRTSPFRVFAEACSSTPFHEDILDCLTMPGSAQALTLSWGSELAFPRWVSEPAKEMIRSLARDHFLAKVEALSEDRPVHQALVSLSFEVELLRQITQRFGQGELAWRSPFLEREVAIPALMLSSADRVRDSRRKSVLLEATRGCVPPSMMNRTSKGDYSRELFDAIRAHRDEILRYFSRSLLAELNVVDMNVLRDAIVSGVNTTDELHSLQSTFETERWLRSVDAACLT